MTTEHEKGHNINGIYRKLQPDQRWIHGFCLFLLERVSNKSSKVDSLPQLKDLLEASRRNPQILQELERVPQQDLQPSIY